jgi:hypothetical protein
MFANTGNAELQIDVTDGVWGKPPGDAKTVHAQSQAGDLVPELVSIGEGLGVTTKLIPSVILLGA